MRTVKISTKIPKPPLLSLLEITHFLCGIGAVSVCCIIGQPLIGLLAMLACWMLAIISMLIRIIQLGGVILGELLDMEVIKLDRD